MYFSRFSKQIGVHQHQGPVIYGHEPWHAPGDAVYDEGLRQGPEKRRREKLGRVRCDIGHDMESPGRELPGDAAKINPGDEEQDCPDRQAVREAIEGIDKGRNNGAPLKRGGGPMHAGEGKKLAARKKIEPEDTEREEIGCHAKKNSPPDAFLVVDRSRPERVRGDIHPVRNLATALY